jgi:NodT family efflux transporter outer membrane factor (OMF) lipoprotein
MSKFLSIFVGLAVSGCVAHTVNTKPKLDVSLPSTYSVNSDTAKLQTPWYEDFNDTNLNALIKTSQDKNLDIRQAVARILQAKTLNKQALALRLPSVNLEGDITKDWQDGSAKDTISSIGASTAWELDIFNRLGSAQKATDLQQQASEDDLDAVRLSLSADIARSYYSAVAQHRQLALLNAQIESDRKLLGLVQKRLKAGVGTNVEVLQQQSQLADNESLIPMEEANLRVAENRLDVLLATAPDGTNRTNSEYKFPEIGDIPATGIPSDLLLNRPDLRAMKNRLIAQDAKIAEAIAERLPRISLSGSLLFVDGTTAASPVSSVLGNLMQPLLDWGRRKAEVERNKALYEEKLASFTHSYLLAIEEVENTLYKEGRQKEYLKRLEKRRELLSQTLDAARAVYEQGESDYTTVLAAIENLRTVERAIVREQLGLILLRIDLFKAIGGNIKIASVNS